MTLSTQDRLDIQQLVARYAWALDTGDVEGFVDCFHSDGELLWDAFDTPLQWRGAAELRRFAEGLRALPASAGRQHHVSNLLVEPADGGARGRAFVLVTLRQPDGAVAAHVAGWYEDSFALEDGKWRIRRRVIRDWAGPVLARFAGQTGEALRRPLPPPLTALLPPREPAT